MQDRADVRLIPPVIPLIGMAVGSIVHWRLPAQVGPDALVQPLGIALIVASVVLVASAARSLSRARTAFDVRRPTTCIVEHGPYRFSRNPVYLAAVLLCWGIGLAANALWVALAAVPSASALCVCVIRREELYLGHKFGPAYKAYQGRVRRWF